MRIRNVDQGMDIYIYEDGDAELGTLYTISLAVLISDVSSANVDVDG